MAKATVKIYDSQGNVVEELPYGTNGITGTNGTGKAQQVHVKTDENGNKIYFAPGLQTADDPFEKIGLDIDEYVEIQAPQVTIGDGQVVLNAPQEVLDSPLAEQVRQELQSLKGADLESQEVKDAINALNEEIRDTVHNWTLQGTLGWSEEEFADYQRLLQAMRQANPLSSTDYFYAKRPGADFYYDDEEGRQKSKKTPQEWLDYWKGIYSAEEREDMYEKSLESTDPYERVMALIMSGGMTTDKDERGYNKIMYGFDTADRLGKFWRTVWDNINLFPKGITRKLATNQDVARVEDAAKEKGVDVSEAMSGVDFMSWTEEDGIIRSPWTRDENAFNEMKDSIRGKSWNELSSAEKLFVLENLPSSENSMERAVDRRGPIYEHTDAGRYFKDVDSEDKEASIEAIKNILAPDNFDDVVNVHSDLMKWTAWEDENINEPEERQMKDSLWAEGNVNAGRIVGTIARYYWENAVGKALTGYSMNKISDAIGEKIISWLSKHNISPTSAVGQGVLKFGANLLGTIPEDIIQDAVDNVLTNNDEQNQYLLDPAQMGENFKRNFLFMAVWNAVMAGVSGLRKLKFARQMKQYAALGEELDFSEAEVERVMTSANDAANVMAKGGHFEVEDGKVYAVDADGKRAVMNNVTVEEAQMMNRAVAEAEASGKSFTGSGAGTVGSTMEDVTLPTKPIDELRTELTNTVARLEELEAQRKAWINNDFKDEDGSDVRQRELAEATGEEIYGTSKLEHLESEIDATRRRLEETNAEYEAAKRIYNADETKTKYEETVEKVKKGTGEVDADDAARAANNAESPKTEAEDGSTRVETDAGTSTSSSRIETEEPSTGYKSLDDAFKLKPEATPEGIRRWHPRILNAILREAATTLFKDFKARFGDVRASDFDWVFYNINNGKSISEIIGSKNPVTGRMVTQNMIDAMKWWADHPMVRMLREKSREGLGKEGDYNKLGYLPHTAYDPAEVTFEEAKAGQLWKKFTGKSMQGENGEFVGYGGDLEGRYRTYASNMLWDMSSKEVTAAKLIEEAELDGKKLSSDEALKMADEVKRLDEKVNKAKSSKSMEKGALKDGSNGLDDFKKAAEEVEKEAPESGAGKAIHDIYGEQYVGHNTATVSKQPSNKVPLNTSLNTQGDTMRNIEINFRGRKMNMYDAAAPLVYAPQNAFELVSRVQRGGLSWKEAITDFVIETSHRSRQYAEQVADRMIAKMAKDARGGRITKGAAIASLTKSFRSEAWARYRRFLALAKYDEFNAKTQAFINDFTFRHMQMDSFANNQSIIAKVANTLTELRYDSLFYGNLKNALLQVSELSRLFTSFKLGDVGSMLKRLATDADFRERVDMYVRAVAPENRGFKAMLYDKYGQAADAMEVGDDGVHFKKLREGKDALDDIALAPINAAESLKNRTMVAALVAEADRLRDAGIIKTDGEYLMHLRQRFERVALAQNEMGRLGFSSNPIAKPMLFLQNFQMRELGMHYYNIFDPDDLDTGGKMDTGGTSKAKLRWNAAKYLMKVFGTKLGVTLILSRLGYSAAQTLGLDPFGLANNYNNLSDDERTWVDDQISHGLLTPFVSSGITSLFADMYFMAREAYEDAHRTTVAEEARENLNKGIGGGADWSMLFEPETWGDLLTNFIPGKAAADRIDQMNQMMSTGWATSASGNKMYTKPDDAFNTMLGYLFGRSATQNAVDYNQTYGDNLGQTLSRTVGQFFADMFGGGYNELDAIDQQNFTDWFDGSENDTQQFEKGRRAFKNERDRIIKTYNDALNNGFPSEEEETEAINDMNRQLDELYEKVGRFVDAYEQKHGTITGKMVKQLINLLNQEVRTTSGTPDSRKQASLDENDKALERYVQYGFPNVGTYTGPTKKYPNTELKYQGSPQWRVQSGARWDVNTEAALVLAAGDAMLEDLRSEMKDLYSAAVQSNDYTEFNKAQNRYLEAFDTVVGPIIATYGNGVLSNKNVKRQLENMLMTSSNGTKVNLIPFDQYGKDKYGRRRSMPTESVDVSKWAKERYDSNVFKNPAIRSTSTAQEDMDTIQRLIDNGQIDMARARALSLKVRVDNQKRVLNSSDYKWLLNFLNNGGTE